MTLLFITAVSVVAGCVRFIASADIHSLVGFVRGLTAAIFVGLNAYHLCRYVDLQPNLEIVVVSVSAFVADYILVAILKVVEYYSRDPVRLVKQIVLKRNGIDVKKGKGD